MRETRRSKEAASSSGPQTPTVTAPQMVVGGAGHDNQGYEGSGQHGDEQGNVTPPPDYTPRATATPPPTQVSGSVIHHGQDQQISPPEQRGVWKPLSQKPSLKNRCAVLHINNLA